MWRSLYGNPNSRHQGYSNEPTITKEVRRTVATDRSRIASIVTWTTCLLRISEHLPNVSETRKIFDGLLDLVVFGRQAADTNAELVKPNSPLVVMPANRLRLHDATQSG